MFANFYYPIEVLPSTPRKGSAQNKNNIYAAEVQYSFQLVHSLEKSPGSPAPCSMDDLSACREFQYFFIYVFILFYVFSNGFLFPCQTWPLEVYLPNVLRLTNFEQRIISLRPNTSFCFPSFFLFYKNTHTYTYIYLFVNTHPF